jgi:hypothetical protein
VNEYVYILYVCMVTSHKHTNITFMKNYVALIHSLLTHYMNHLPVLGMSFYGPVRTIHDQEAIKYVKHHRERAIMHDQVAGSLAEACGNACTSFFNAVSRFSMT